MSDMLNKTIVLVLNRNWQAINIRTPADAFCQMATNVATALEIDGENYIRPVAWDEWITLATIVHRRRTNPKVFSFGLIVFTTETHIVPRLPEPQDQTCSWLLQVDSDLFRLVFLDNPATVPSRVARFKTRFS